ncbi:pilus assembly protein TadG-related protein [Terrabacter sp. RAF57]|uniref:pilus assembly protein TadG-related protein n=1 Tax=Terrabacter sp. RAF57 TaxID=3233063 RepID=UPI003F952D64
MSRWNHVRFGRRDRGATAIVVAASLTLLLGFAAMALDMGHAYWEKTQLQAGADTAALSVADACAKDAASVACATATDTSNTSSIPRVLANSAANDAKSAVTSVSLNTGTGVVTVVTAAQEDGAAAGKINTWFGRVFGINDISVSATATARWGAPTGGTAKMPLTFSSCEIDSSATADGSLQYLLSHGISDAKGTDGCHDTGSGQELPGGFGWLAPEPAGTCSVQTLIGSWETSDPGNNFPAYCTSTLTTWKATLQAGGTVVALFPVFDTISADKKSYQVKKYAAIQIRGWHFKNNDPVLEYLPSDAAAVFASYKNSDLGFVGKFIRYVFSDDDATTGGGTSTTGATVVDLSN